MKDGINCGNRSRISRSKRRVRRSHKRKPVRVRLDRVFCRTTDAKTYNLNFILGGECGTVHYALGETPSSDRVGVVTISYTV